MSLSPNSGVGLKAVSGPQGLKIASSPFTAQPNNDVAAADVYDITNPGVINSVVEDLPKSVGFLDSVKNAISGAMGAGKDVMGSLAAKSKDIIGAVRKGTALVKSVTNVASRAMSAVNQIKNGGIMGAISGAGSLAGIAGVSGVGSLVSQARGVAYGLQRGGVAGYLGAAGSLLGNEGKALSQLAGNVSAIERLADRSKYALNGGISGMLSMADASVSLAASTIGTLDRASQIDFTKGYDAVMNHGTISGKTLSQSALGKVYSAVGDLTTGISNVGVRLGAPNTAVAGVATGLVTLGSSHGDPKIFSSLVDSGLDDATAFFTGSTCTALASQSGDLGVLADIVSTPVGKRAVASNPNALRATVSNLTPTSASVERSLAETYVIIDGVAVGSGQSWNLVERGAKVTLDVSSIKTNDYALDVVAAKASKDHFDSPRLSEKNATKAEMSDAQFLYAAGAW